MIGETNYANGQKIMGELKQVKVQGLTSFNI